MRFSGQQVGQIRDALLDAYGAKDDLRMMARIELDENLEAIAGGENLRVVVFNLVSWAEEAGRTEELVHGAYRQKPGNPALQQLVVDMEAWHAGLAADAPVRPEIPRRPGPASIDLFLSYSRKDEAAMRVVRETLRSGGLSVWTDEGLEPGTQSWRSAIEEAVEQCSAMVALLSSNAKASRWVDNEVGYAQTLGKTVFPILVDDDEVTAVPINLINSQRVDGRSDLQQAVGQELLPVLRRHVRTSDSAVQTMLPELDNASSPTPVASKKPRPMQRYSLFALIVVAAVIVAGLSIYLVRAYLTQQAKQAIIVQMASPDNATAVEAVRIARERDWLFDGTFRGADLRKANLESVDLRGAELWDVDLGQADLSNADLSNAGLSNANLEGTNLESADLVGATLYHATLRDANLRNANLSETDLSDAFLVGADLNHADLTGANLLNANLSRSDLGDADLSGTNLTEANLTDANLQGAISDEDTTWPTGFDEGAINATDPGKLPPLEAMRTTNYALCSVGDPIIRCTEEFHSG